MPTSHPLLLGLLSASVAVRILSWGNFSVVELGALGALRGYRIGTPIISYRGRKPESYLVL